MAANIMTEILKKIQEDLINQREYMMNLHIIHVNTLNEKFNCIAGKIFRLDEKLDQQQVTIEKIKQQVQKNNVLLFGNEDNRVDTVISGNLGVYDEVEKCHLFEQTDNSIENAEENALSTLNLTSMHEDQSNCEEDNNLDESMKADAKDKSVIIKELREIKQLITVERKPSNEGATNPILEQITELKELVGNELREIKQSINSIHNSVTKSNATIEEATNSNHKQTAKFGESVTNGLREIKESITRDIIAERNITVEETGNSNNKQTTEMRKFIANELQDMKELITSLKGYVVERKTVMEGTANTGCKQKTVQISPTYFSADQISKLNEELKRVAEMYRSSGVFPVVEVVSGSADEHPVMKRLREGVRYTSKVSDCNPYAIKLGRNGWKTSDVRDLLTDYPNLLLYDVVKELLKSRVRLSGFSKKYNILKPLPYHNYE